jgi:kojibiose phosphorylase
MEHGQVLEHRRILDFRRGTFWREWRHRDSDGKITRIVAFRLASLADRHLLLHSVSLTAENYTSTVRFESSMAANDTEVSLLAPKWKARSDSARPNILPLSVRVPGRETTVTFGVTSQMTHSGSSAGCRTLETGQRSIMEHCDVDVQPGGECRLDRLVSVFSSRETATPLQNVSEHLKKAISKGVSAVVSEHAAQWDLRWRAADIEVEGDDDLQQALRFAAYHLISAANPDDNRVSIGARSLSGPAYKGHVFWDTEIYMLPFFIFTHPASARALLEYRYHTLDAAREKARSFRFRGAMYPWESADTGEETTPRFIIAPNGEVLIVRNGELEVHITADIAYAVWQYWNCVRDEDFFIASGAEIMLESARFWASRGMLESDGYYHIRRVIGPDEYHEEVDDNAFTNLMAAWNLRQGLKTFEVLRERWPSRWRDLISSLQITDDETKTWATLAQAMFIPFNAKTLLYEQFSGYFEKEEIHLKSYEPRSAAMDMILGQQRIQQTNILKQADVVLATYLLWDDIPADVRAANFRYYEPRTSHGSSLSPAIHALMAARIGDGHLAQQYLKQASEIDLSNNMGNAAGGVHAASLGGLWQAIVFGFAGMRAHSDGVSFDPKLLPNWERLSFPVEWRGRKLRVQLEPKAIRVASSGPEALKLQIEQGPEVRAMPERAYVAERTELGWEPWRVTEQKEFI